MFGTTAAWGLDIGSSTMKAVKLRRAGGGVEVVDFDVIEIEHSDDDSTRDMRNAAAIAEVVKRKKFGRTPVVVSVAGNQVFFRPFSLPAVGERKIPEIVRYEARQQVPFPLEEVVWDYRAGSTGGTDLSVSLVAIRREIVERLLTTLRQHQLNVAGIAPSPVAALNFVQYDLQPTETCLILDAGAKVTDFVVLHGGGFWFRPLPVAGDDITHVFEQKFRMPFAEAENLKTKLAESKQYEKMFQVIEPALRSLAGEIQRTSGYYLSLQRNVRITRVLGMGQAFRLKGLTEFLTQNVEVEVEMVSAPQRVAVSSGIDTTWFAEEFPGMGPALGLALQGLGLAQVEMRLLPESEVSARRARGRRKVFAVAAAAVVALVVNGYALAVRETAGIKGSEGVNAQMEERLRELAGLQDQIGQASRLVSPLRQQMERWALTGVERGAYGEVLGRLLANVSAHNAMAREQHLKTGKDPKDAPAGEVLISDLYVSSRNPRINSGFTQVVSDPDASALTDRSDGRLYVLAKFECRGPKGGYATPDDALRFEASLHRIEGFSGALPVKEGTVRKWLLRGEAPEFVPHFSEEWRTSGKAPLTAGTQNGLVFCALWLYDPGAVRVAPAKPKPEGGEAEPAGEAGNEAAG